MQNYEALICEAEKELAPVFERLNAIETENTRRVLRAFQKHRVSARNFAPTTGYGYDDMAATRCPRSSRRCSARRRR